MPCRPEATGRKTSDVRRCHPPESDAPFGEDKSRVTSVARPEATGHRTCHPTDEPADAYSVEEFCRRHGISIPLFYKMQRAGLGPRTFLCGVRRLISREAAAEWRRQREEAANA